MLKHLVTEKTTVQQSTVPSFFFLAALSGNVLQKISQSQLGLSQLFHVRIHRNLCPTAKSHGSDDWCWRVSIFSVYFIPWSPRTMASWKQHLMINWVTWVAWEFQQSLSIANQFLICYVAVSGEVEFGMLMVWGCKILSIMLGCCAYGFKYNGLQRRKQIKEINSDTSCLPLQLTKSQMPQSSVSPREYRICLLSPQSPPCLQICIDDLRSFCSYSKFQQSFTSPDWPKTVTQHIGASNFRFRGCVEVWFIPDFWSWTWRNWATKDQPKTRQRKRTNQAQPFSSVTGWLGFVHLTWKSSSDSFCQRKVCY